MFLNEYTVHERRKDLLREADQRRLAREVEQAPDLTAQIGKQLLMLSVALVRTQPDECYTVETRGQSVTVCPA